MARILFHGGLLFDGTGAEPAPADVVVDDDRIAHVGAPGTGDGDTSVDLEGKTLLPGFFDCHVHVTFDVVDVMAALQTPFSYRFFVAARSLERTIRTGITSVRDAAGADAGVRRAVDEGMIPGPRMQIAIDMISQTGGHGDEHFGCGHEIPLLSPAYPGHPKTIVDGPVEMRPPSPGELRRLLEHVAETNPLLHLLLVLAATTGARRGQLLALRWTDVDLDRGALRFQRALVEGPDGPVLAPTKTRRPHRVALDPGSLALVRDRHAQIAAKPIGNPGGFVFTSDPTGERPWLPNWVTKQFIDARRHAGVGQFRLHDLRHFMATEMLNAGVPIPIVSARLAHARASTTLNVYAHAVPGGDHHAAETISAILSAG